MKIRGCVEFACLAFISKGISLEEDLLCTRGGFRLLWLFVSLLVAKVLSVVSYDSRACVGSDSLLREFFAVVTG